MYMIQYRSFSGVCMDEVGQLINELSCGITNTNNKIDNIGNYNIINNSPVEEIENDIKGLNGVIKKINRYFM